MKEENIDRLLTSLLMKIALVTAQGKELDAKDIIEDLENIKSCYGDVRSRAFDLANSL